MTKKKEESFVVTKGIIEMNYNEGYDKAIDKAVSILEKLRIKRFTKIRVLDYKMVDYDEANDEFLSDLDQAIKEIKNE